MSRTTAPLSDSACRSAKPTDGAYKLFDGDGLYLLVQPMAANSGGSVTSNLTDAKD
ncbi:Integrase [Pseudomonas sp. R4-35-07]|nr:Integrase [Pseudomonas sp. R4-35-07]